MTESDGGKASHVPDRRVVYVVRGQDEPRDADELDLGRWARTFWLRRRWIVGSALVWLSIGLAYALLATPVYRAEAVLLLREGKGLSLSGQLGQLGNLAGLAGIDLGSKNKQEPLGVLRSKGFVRRFIAQNDLMPVLVESHTGLAAIRNDKPDLRKVADRFSRSIMGVTEDPKTGLVTVGVEWKDPKVAASWANRIVAQLNEEMRQRALSESKFNLQYLRGQIETTRSVALQASLAKLIESEMQKFMLAQGTEEYAYRVIDAAEPPALREWPKRTLIVLIAPIIGVLFAVALIIVWDPMVLMVRSARGEHPATAA